MQCIPWDSFVFFHIWFCLGTLPQRGHLFACSFYSGEACLSYEEGFPVRSQFGMLVKPSHAPLLNGTLRNYIELPTKTCRPE